MARAYNANCLVIKHAKLGETDTIVTMLSDEGVQIRAVAKGLRKPGNRIGARLQLFSEVSLLLHQGKSLDVVGEAKTINANASLREGLEIPASASVIAEMLEKLGRDGAQLEERMFPMSTTALHVLPSLEPNQAAAIVSGFLFKTMAMQGFAPAVRECALCGTPIDHIEFFDVSYGGALCLDCAGRLGIRGTVDPMIAAWVRALLQSTFAEISEFDGIPSLELLDLAGLWVHEHLSINLKSLMFLKTLI